MPLPAPGRTVEALRRSTAFISSRHRSRAGTGSAIVLTNDTLVTNAHVVGAGALQVESWEGKTTTATVLKIDHSRDLALLHAPGLGAAPASLADSAAVPPGTPVVAVGNPVGFKGAVSTGTVHSSGPISINGIDPALSRLWICADIHLAPGNSGGPLADWEGRVIGVNTMVTYGGLALAVPSRAVNAFLSADKRRSLGVTLRPVRLSAKGADMRHQTREELATSSGGALDTAPVLREFLESQQVIGLLILEMEPGGAAALASLLPGDILIGANEEPFRNIEDLETALARVRDQMLTLQFRRGGDQKGRRVTVQWANAPITTAA